MATKKTAILVFIFLLYASSSAASCHPSDPEVGTLSLDSSKCPTDQLQSLTSGQLSQVLSQLPAERIKELKPEQLGHHLSSLSAEQLNGVIASQLTHKNQEGTLNFDKVADKNLLNPDVRNEILNQLGGTTETIQTNTDNQPTEIESTPNGFFIPDNIYQFSLGDVSVSNGKGIRYENNVLTIEQADTIQIKDGIIVQAKNFTGNSIEFSVGRAESVIIDGTTISHISNSTFEITDEGIKIDSRSDASFTITDSSYVTSSFKGNGTLIIETPSHAQNIEASFAIDELVQWIEETIAAIPQNALVTFNGTTMPAKNAMISGIPLYYDVATHTIISGYIESSIALAYEASIDKLVPAYLPLPSTTTTSSLPLPIFAAQQLVNEVVDIVEQTATDITVYTITDGILTFESETGIEGISEAYNETIDTINSTAVIVVDPAFGMACIQLMPKSAYNYVDPIIEKDFSLYIPANGAPYALCLRKSISQQLTGYEGIADFTSKEMSLKNIINYKRYPLKNNKIADTLTTEVFEGKSNSRAELRYLPNFILLDAVMLHDVSAQSQAIAARTKPSNYYSITEEAIEGQKKRLVVVNWRLTSSQYTQSIPQSYAADDGLPKLTLAHNVLIQDNGNTRITILPPEHETIATLVE